MTQVTNGTVQLTAAVLHSKFCQQIYDMYSQYADSKLKTNLLFQFHQQSFCEVPLHSNGAVWLENTQSVDRWEKHSEYEEIYAKLEEKRRKPVHWSAISHGSWIHSLQEVNPQRLEGERKWIKSFMYYIIIIYIPSVMKPHHQLLHVFPLVSLPTSCLDKMKWRLETLVWSLLRATMQRTWLREPCTKEPHLTWPLSRWDGLYGWTAVSSLINNCDRERF